MDYRDEYTAVFVRIYTLETIARMYGRGELHYVATADNAFGETESAIRNGFAVIDVTMKSRGHYSVFKGWALIEKIATMVWGDTAADNQMVTSRVMDDNVPNEEK